MSELKPCPFCKSIKHRTRSGSGDPYGYLANWIQCDQCEMCGPVAMGKEDAAAFWNALPRPTPDAGFLAGLEAAREAIRPISDEEELSPIAEAQWQRLRLLIEAAKKEVEGND